MARFGFVGAAYTSEAVNADCQSCINWYVEQIESGTGASAAALYPTPGITPFAGPIGSGSHLRGSYEFEGRCFVVTDKLYEVFADGSNDGGHGYPPDDGQPVTMAANSAGQLLVCGGGQMWVHPLVPYINWNIASVAYIQAPPHAHFGDKLVITPGPTTGISPGTTVYLAGLTTHPELSGTSAQVMACTPGPSGSITLTPPQPLIGEPYFSAVAETGQIETAPEGQVGLTLGVPIQSVDFCDGYFLALAKNSATFYSSQLEDGTTWDPSFSYTVSEFAENVIAMKVLRREVWLFSSKHILPYYDAGDPLTPFQPNPSAFIETGIGAAWSVAKLAGTLFWLGADERGRCLAFMAQGYSPVRISTHALENEWTNMSIPTTVPGASWGILNISYEPPTPTINVPHFIVFPAGATLAAGATVRLSGLTAHPECNGLTTVIEATGSVTYLNPPPGLAGRPYFSNIPETGTVSSMPTVSVGVEDAISYAMQINGHAFWHIYFPTAARSWRFDATTGMWAEVAFWDIFDGAFTAHPTVNHVEVFGKHLLGSAGSPYLFWTDKSLLTDNIPASPNNPIRRVRRAPHVSNELEWEFHHRLRVHLETGLGPMPPLTGQGEGDIQLAFNIPLPPDTWNILTIAYVGPGAPAIPQAHVEIIPGSLESIPPGAVVQLAGLTAHPELNGPATVITNSNSAIALVPPPALSGQPYFNSMLETGTVSTVGESATLLVQIGDDGSWNPTGYPQGVPAESATGIYNLIDIGLLPYQKIVYQLTVDASFNPVLVLLSPPESLSGYVQRLPLITYPSGLQTGISVQSGRLVIDTPHAAPVEPEVMLRWSDDGGHTWSNEYVCGAGMAGNFRRRAEWRRLGRSRDRVYEVAVSDPIPWRLVDAYLFTSPSNQQPMQRYAQQLAKMA